MVVAKRKKVRVFYAWQSDLPAKTNLSAIRNALRAAAKELESERPKIKVRIDEATRGASGSPNIPATLLRKIEKADIFVGDVTTITPAGAALPCPNANVVYELGYASGELGWDRIIFLFNKAHGAFPTDLPFDFAQHRGSPYSFGLMDGKPAKVALAKLLKVALAAVLDKNPKRPAELRGVSRKKIQHERDVENMTWLMSSIHIPTLEEHIENLPNQITNRGLWFWEHANGVLANGLFDVYDTVLKENAEKLHVAWQKTVSHDDCYRDTPSGQLHIFGNPYDQPFTQHQQDAWDEILQARQDMAEALTVILERIRKDYIEIDILKTNKKAWADYVKFREQLDPAIGGGNEQGPKKVTQKKKQKK